MHHFNYRGGVLHAEDVAVPTIASAVGTPVYIYSSATIERLDVPALTTAEPAPAAPAK